MAFCLFSFAIIGFTQIGNLPLKWLEAQYKVPVLSSPPHGIIVLGGGIQKDGFNAQSNYHLFDASDRIIKAAALKNKYPSARLIYTGGSGDLVNPKKAGAYAAKRLFDELFAGKHKIELETKSKNTWENGKFTIEMIPKAERDKKWLLVTSAWHMRRSMGVFNKLNMKPIPYPTDFTAGELEPPFLTPYPTRQFNKVDLFAKEIIGTIVYQLTDKYSE